MKWYAAYTHPKKERWARTNLWELGFEVYLPEYLKVRRHARRTDEVARPLFPRYLFVAASAENALPPNLAGTARGVVDLVRMGRALPSVPDALIREIRLREADDGLVRLGRQPLRKGQAVRVASGPMSDHVGIFECRDDNQRIVMLFSMLGREVRVRVDADAVVPNLA